MTERNLIEGTPVLLVIDIQGGEAAAAAAPGGPAIPPMPGYDECMSKAPALQESP